MSVEEIVSGIDAIIVTHLHPDHLDEFAIKALPKDLPLFTQDETDAKVVKGFGFKDVRILNYDGTKFFDILMFRIDGLHGHPETTQKYYDAGHFGTLLEYGARQYGGRSSPRQGRNAKYAYCGQKYGLLAQVPRSRPKSGH